MRSSTLRNGAACWLSLVIGATAVTAARSGAIRTLEGTLRIGDEPFHVVLEVQDRAIGYWLTLAVIGKSGGVVGIAADLRESSPFYVFGDVEHQLTPTLARTWSSDIKSEFRALADALGFTCVELTATELVLESREPVALTEFLVGRVRLRYLRNGSLASDKALRTGPWVSQGGLVLRVVEVYSVPDWLNGFGDSVVLFLTRRNDEGGD